MTFQNQLELWPRLRYRERERERERYARSNEAPHSVGVWSLKNVSSVFPGSNLVHSIQKIVLCLMPPRISYSPCQFKPITFHYRTQKNISFTYIEEHLI